MLAYNKERRDPAKDLYALKSVCQKIMLPVPLCLHPNPLPRLYFMYSAIASFQCANLKSVVSRSM